MYVCCVVLCGVCVCMCTYAQTYKHLHAAAVPGPEGLDGSHVGISVARKHRPELVEGIQTELVDEA